MLFNISMSPIGFGDNLSHSVAQVVDEIDEAGLDYRELGRIVAR